MIRKIKILAVSLAVSLSLMLVAAATSYALRNSKPPPTAPFSQIGSISIIQTKKPVLEPFGGQKWGIPENLSIRTGVVLTDLIWCESRANGGAVNKIDLDGTPSYGLLQFKPLTLWDWATKHKILDIEKAEIMNVIFDGQVQIDAFLAEYEENGQKEAWWKQNFPGCFAKYKEKWAKMLF